MPIDALKDFLVPLFFTVLGSAFAGGATVAWWGVRRIVTGQDTINKTLTEIRDELGQTHGQIVGLETWAEQHEKQNDTWQQRSEQDRRDIWTAVRRGA